MAGGAGGVSLVSTALGSRQMWISSSKLEIIQEELKSRGFALYEEHIRDTLILFSITVATMGIGVEFSELVMNTAS